MGKLGGVAVLNLDGVHTRYEDSAPIIKRIAEADKSHVNAVLKEVYREPVKPNLITERIKAIKAAGVPCAVSSIPARAEERAPQAAPPATRAFRRWMEAGGIHTHKEILGAPRGDHTRDVGRNGVGVQGLHRGAHGDRSRGRNRSRSRGHQRKSFDKRAPAAGQERRVRGEFGRDALGE